MSKYATIVTKATSTQTTLLPISWVSSKSRQRKPPCLGLQATSAQGVMSSVYDSMRKRSSAGRLRRREDDEAVVECWTLGGGMMWHDCSAASWDNLFSRGSGSLQSLTEQCFNLGRRRIDATTEVATCNPASVRQTSQTTARFSVSEAMAPARQVTVLSHSLDRAASGPPRGGSWRWSRLQDLYTSFRQCTFFKSEQQSEPKIQSPSRGQWHDVSARMI